MKVLICSTNDIKGGAARAAYRIFQGITLSKEIDVKLLVADKNSNNNAVIELSKIKDRKGLRDGIQSLFFKIYKKIKWYAYPKRRIRGLSDLFNKGINNEIKNIDFDILNLHWVSGEFMNLKELKKAKVPIVWTLHDCYPFTGICHYFEDCQNFKSSCGKCPQLSSEKSFDLSQETFNLKKKRYEGLNLHIVSPSKWLADSARKSSLFAQFPVHVIPNGIDTEIFAPKDKGKVRASMHIDESRKVILFGAMSATNDIRKGYKYLLEALNNKQLSKKGILLLVFGSEDDGGSISTCETKYLGSISNDDQLASIYSIADVMVVPSTHENLSNTIMESLACGTPVTAFNIGGNMDMIDHLENGYLAKPYSSEDLAYGINWCLDNNRNLKTNARKKVLDNFRIETISTRYTTLFKSILNDAS
jgi:glycosyltransferase involved in cell wall biosynthesis